MSVLFFSMFLQVDIDGAMDGARRQLQRELPADGLQRDGRVPHEAVLRRQEAPHILRGVPSQREEALLHRRGRVERRDERQVDRFRG